MFGLVMETAALRAPYKNVGRSVGSWFRLWLKGLLQHGAVLRLDFAVGMAEAEAEEDVLPHRALVFGLLARVGGRGIADA